MKSIKMLIVTVFLWQGFFSTSAFASSGVTWDGKELAKGQIGLLTIQKPINLWERKKGQLLFSRILKPGEKYRVYGYDHVFKQYRVGGSFVVTNMPDRIAYKTPSKQKLGLLMNTLEYSELVDKIVIVDPQYKNREETLKIKKELTGLSLGLLEKLRINQINVVIVDEPITNFPEFAYLKGTIPKGWENSGKTWDDLPGAGGERRVIIRIGYEDYLTGHGAISLTLHETAHSIDHFIYTNLSQTEEFQKIWKKEVASLFGSHPYYSNYPEEYFAETFAMFYFNENSKQKLKTFAPLTYTLFENLN